MKLCGMLSVLALVMSGITSYSQDLEAEVPGDNFSLEGALELFKKSESPEHFEKLLNSPDSKVNNLDLNGDGYIDYIRVFDRYKGNVHAFILQAVVTENESQDIAVIELEKRSNGKAVLQIIGDEDIYGVETIIEPTSEVRTYAGARTSTTVVNVWGWPSVQYIYGPYYSAWYSPWTWHAYPVWWRSWRPIAYVHYHPIYVRYRPYYSYCYERRISHAHHIYHPYRTTSVVVSHRHRDQINHYRSNSRDGYARGDRGRNYSAGRSTNNINADQPRRNHDNVNRSFSGRSGANESDRKENSRVTDNSRNSESVNRVQRQQERVISNERTMRQQQSREVQAPKVNSSERERNPVTRNNPSTQRTEDVRQNSERRSREVATPPTRSYEAPQRTRSAPREQSRTMSTSPSRSGNVQRSTESRQMSRPSVERRSPAASPRQQAPGGSRSSDRGR